MGGELFAEFHSTGRPLLELWRSSGASPVPALCCSSQRRLQIDPNTPTPGGKSPPCLTCPFYGEKAGVGLSTGIASEKPSARGETGPGEMQPPPLVQSKPRFYIKPQ
jgi:hypothetical protein